MKGKNKGGIAMLRVDEFRQKLDEENVAPRIQIILIRMYKNIDRSELNG